MSDRCAECFALLMPAPTGGRWPCVLHPRAGYLSKAVPEHGNTDKACVKSKHGRPTLHVYGAKP